MKRMLTMIAKSDAQALFITGDLFDESTAIKDMNNFIENIKMFSEIFSVFSYCYLIFIANPFYGNNAIKA